MSENNEKLLAAYLATSGYTIRAIEEAIDDLKESLSASTNSGLRYVYLDRIEDLENQLATITYLD